MPPDTEEAAQALTEARTQTGTAAIPALAKAARLGSTEAQFSYALILINGIAGEKGMGAGFDIMLSLAKRGHGSAALYLSALSSKSDDAGVNRHGPYWANIARRAGNEAALSSYDKALKTMRADGDIPPGSGTGDYFDKAITFSQPVKDSAEGVPLEYKTVAALLPGWRRWRQSLHQMDDKAYDVLDMTNEDGQVVKVYFDITAWYAKGAAEAAAPAP